MLPAEHASSIMMYPLLQMRGHWRLSATASIIHYFVPAAYSEVASRKAMSRSKVVEQRDRMWTGQAPQGTRTEVMLEEVEEGYDMLCIEY